MFQHCHLGDRGPIRCNRKGLDKTIRSRSLIAQGIGIIIHLNKAVIAPHICIMFQGTCLGDTGSIRGNGEGADVSIISIIGKGQGVGVRIDLDKGKV